MKFSETHNLPRERLLFVGPEQLNDYELVAIILGTGKKGENVLDMARKVTTVLKKETIRTPQQLNEQTKIGIVKSCKIIASLYLGGRIYTSRASKSITCSEEAYIHFKDMEFLEFEECRVLYLDTKNRVIRKQTVSKGALNKMVVHPREIFVPAIREAAAGIILAHNHPGGDSSPSDDDETLTARLKKAGKLLGIQVLDHLIIGKNNYYSFTELAINPI